MKIATFSAKKTILASLFVAIGAILPALFHVIWGAGSIFLPMHIPVLLCGLICGYMYGGLCGIIVPLLASLLTGMPPIYPNGISMVFELATYGIISGLFFKRLNIYVIPRVYISLIGAMIVGRFVSGISNTILFGLAGEPYGISTFLTGAFVTALPGITLQIILIPTIIILLKKVKTL